MFNLLKWIEFKQEVRDFPRITKQELDLLTTEERARLNLTFFEMVNYFNDFEQVFDLYCTKALDWQYEQEWRCLHMQGGIEYTYPLDALTGIYMGPEMPSSAFEIIALILSGQSTHVQLWQGRRSNSKFMVEFGPVTYTSHLEAKRRGLLPRRDA